MKIYIPTFYGDIDLLKTQCNLFKQNCTKDQLANITYIVNEYSLTKINAVKSVIEQHNLKYKLVSDLISISWFKDIDGWTRQQIIKLCCGVGKYVVLDTKNFLIKPITAFNSSICPVRHGLDSVLQDSLFLDFFQASVNNYKSVTSIRPIITPYLIDSKITQQIFKDFRGFTQFVEWFCSFECPSEFIIYDIADQIYNKKSKYGTKHRVNLVIWNRDDIQKIYEPNERLRFLSLHRNAYDECLTDIDIKSLLQIL